MKKQLKIKIENFGELKLDSVKVESFIWHLSPKRNRDSILKNGLRISNNEKLIYANNFNRDLHSMWPIPIESMYKNLNYENNNYETLKTSIIESVAPNFDFWRIDTKKTNNEWFIDPFLKDELKIYSHSQNNPNLYVCTLTPIPIDCLKLFEYCASSKEGVFVQIKKGVTHISGLKLPLKEIY